MERGILLAMLIVFSVTGCTTMSLERHTVNQIQSVADYRYHATLHAIAMVAANPGTIPSYAQLSGGIDSVSTTGIANAATSWAWAPEVIFKSEVLGLTGAHSPQMSWTVDPVADFTQLDALRSACLWVLAGPDRMDATSISILTDPEKDLSPGSHFGVIDRLTQLPLGWLHVGRSCDVPRNAYCREHCGDTWVWVTQDGIEGLSGFTLVLQDIATLNIAPSDGTTAPANRLPPTLVTLWVVQNTFPPPPPAIPPPSSTASPATPPDKKDSPYSQTAVFRVERVVRPECMGLIQEQINKRLTDNNQSKVVEISWDDWMQWTTPFQGYRASVKPGTPQATPSPLPLSRRLTPPPEYTGRSATPAVFPNDLPKAP